MTLALYGKSKRRQGGLLLAGLLAIALALLGALVISGSPAKAATTSGFAGDDFTIDTDWASEANAVGSNQATFASRQGSMQRQGYRDFGLNVPAGSTINGITVEVYGRSTEAACKLQVGIYQSPTNNYATAVVRTVDTPTANAIMTFGGPSDLWGHTWTPANFADSGSGSFRLYIRNFDDNSTCITGGSSSTNDTWYVATIHVTVDYTPPADDDNDGVPNSTDQCPGTAPGATTYGTGCSVVQYIAMLQGGTANTISGDFCTEGDFNFVIDMSGSIGVQDGHPSNLPAMQAGITGFVNAYNAPAPGTADGRYSGTIFNGNLSGDQDPITAGFVSDAVFNTAVNALSGPAGFTPTAAGIIGAGTNNANDRVGVPNMMLVVTDGSPNVPDSGLGTGDPMRWVNAAQAAINAADAARANYLVRAVYVAAPDDPGDTLLPFNDADDATWAQAVMDLIDGSPAGALSADFSALATALLEASGCEPETRDLWVTKLIIGDTPPDPGPEMQWFDYSVQPANIVDELAQTQSTDNWSIPVNVLQTVKETELLSAPWSFAGYELVAGIGGCTGAPVPPQAQDAGIEVPANTTDYTVCIYNRYTEPEPETRNLQICKVVVGNGDLAIRSGSFNFDVRENGATVLNGIGGINASEPNPDTNGTNGTEVCKTVQVATDKSISVAEWGGRPAGWSTDATGYPKYAIGGGGQVAGETTTGIAAGTSDIKVTFFNREQLPTVNVTFSKYICNSLGDIARNQDGAGDDDVGKPSMSATGGLSAQLGAVGALGNDTAVTPANDGRNQANCHLWGTAPGETGTWDMEIYNTSRTGNPLQTINIPEGGTITTALLPAVLLEALAPSSSGARVEEVFKTGYGFGSLKCYTDHLHQDNWEWLDFNPGGIPTGEIHCIAYNVPADTELIVDKIFENLGGHTPGPGDVPTLNLPAGVTIKSEGFLPAPDDDVYRWVLKVPYGVGGDITENVKAGWVQLPTKVCTIPQVLGPGGTTVSLQVQAQEVLESDCLFRNAPFGTLTINKINNVSGAGVLWDFTVSGITADVYGDPLDTTPQASQSVPSVQTNIPLSGNSISVTELAAGITNPALCVNNGDLFTQIIAPDDKVISQPGENIVWTFINTTCGDVLGTGGVLIEKWNDVNRNGILDGADVRLPGWTFTTTAEGQIPGGIQVRQTNATGQILDYVGGLLTGTKVTTTESSQPYWALSRVTVDGVAVATNLTTTVEILEGEVRIIRYLNYFDPPTIIIPTPTPTTPATSTPTPTNTPGPDATPTSTPVPGETPTEDPTVPQSTVAGDRTPGPGDPTPAAPDTGAGFGGTSTGMNILLLIAGLIAISGGLSFIALGRRQTSR